ncbi:hypothetical protein [Pseudomonas sp. LW8]|uniref:hypothetical protein n=1 Tax=Pseudomonas sp. LW8 TaxID=3242677 RepID=UPI0035C0B2DE
MSTNEKPKIGGPTNTKVVHVGSELFKKLVDEAIDISHQGRRQITPSQIAQYLINNYLPVAAKKLLKEIKETEEK